MQSSILSYVLYLSAFYYSLLLLYTFIVLKCPTIFELNCLISSWKVMSSTFSVRICFTIAMELWLESHLVSCLSLTIGTASLLNSTPNGICHHQNLQLHWLVIFHWFKFLQIYSDKQYQQNVCLHLGIVQSSVLFIYHDWLPFHKWKILMWNMPNSSRCHGNHNQLWKANYTLSLKPFQANFKS